MSNDEVSDIPPEIYAPVFRILYRKMMYEKTGNGMYAAQAWTICRQAKMTLPDWLLDAVDAAAERGYFYTVQGRGKGASSDERKWTANHREVQIYIVPAYELYAQDPTLSQNALADRLRVDPGLFARILKKWQATLGPYPWRSN